MIKRVLLIFTLFIVNFGFSQSINCDNIAICGGINICLPNIVGLSECYAEPLVKKHADLTKGTDGEIVLGVYILSDLCESLSKSDEVPQSSYPTISVKSHEYFKERYVDKEEVLDLFSSSFKSGLEVFEEIREEQQLDSKLKTINPNLTQKTPIFLEEYKVSSKIRSLVTIKNYILNDENFFETLILNVILIKNRIILVTYLDEYKGLNNIKETKTSNDNFVLELLEKN